MEPINLHVDGAGTVSRWSRRPDHGDYAMVPRADYDALVRERDEAVLAAKVKADVFAAVLKQRDEVEREAERRVLEAAIRWLSARQDDAESIVVLLDATKAYAALRGKEAPRG